MTTLYKNIRWTHINTVDIESIAYLTNTYAFHPLDLKDLEEEDSSPKLDSYKEYLFLVLQFPGSNDEKKVIMSECSFFIGKEYLITITRSPWPELEALFTKVTDSAVVQEEWMSENAALLSYQIIETLFESVRPVISRVGKQLTKIEQNIFLDKNDRTTIKQLAELRRAILTLRRTLDPERQVLTSLAHVHRPFVGDNMALYFEDVLDYVNTLWATIEMYNDTIDGLHVTAESLINQRTNKIIRTLTVMSACLLPFTLLSSIYGMNIEHLPFAHHPNIIWLIYAFLAGVIVLGVIWLKKKNYL